MDTESSFPKPGFYYHFKHDPKRSINNYACEVLHIAFDPDDERKLPLKAQVVYLPLYKEATTYQEGNDRGYRALCPLSKFIKPKIIDGREVLRYRRITDPELIAKLETLRDAMYR